MDLGSSEVHGLHWVHVDTQSEIGMVSETGLDARKEIIIFSVLFFKA